MIVTTKNRFEEVRRMSDAQLQAAWISNHSLSDLQFIIKLSLMIVLLGGVMHLLIGDANYRLYLGAILLLYVADFGTRVYLERTAPHVPRRTLEQSYFESIQLPES